MFSSQTRALTSISYASPSGTTGTKKNISNSNPYWYQVQNDCLLYVRVVSKSGAGPMVARAGGDGQSNRGYIVSVFPDNDAE